MYFVGRFLGWNKGLVLLLVGFFVLIGYFSIVLLVKPEISSVGLTQQNGVFF